LPAPAIRNEKTPHSQNILGNAALEPMFPERLVLSCNPACQPIAPAKPGTRNSIQPYYRAICREIFSQANAGR